MVDKIIPMGDFYNPVIIFSILKFKEMTCRQLADPIPEGLVRQPIAPVYEIICPYFVVSFLWQAGCKKCLNFARKIKQLIFYRIIKGLNTKPVPGSKYGFFPLVPNREAEHAITF